MQCKYHTGAVHPNNVAAPEIANVALIVEPVAHIPKQAVVRPANPSTRLNSLKYHRPLKSPCGTCQCSEHWRPRGDSFTLFQRDQSFQVSIRPSLPLPGLNVLSSIMASVITWYPSHSRGGNVNVNCMTAAAPTKPTIVWICGMDEQTTNAGKSFSITQPHVAKFT